MDDESHCSIGTEENSVVSAGDARALARSRAYVDPRCPHHSPLSRHNSNQSCQSSSTVNTFGNSKDDSPHKDGHLNHLHIPGLKRTDAKTSTIRQHYYPEGGWGWLVTACAFMVQVLTTGLQLSYGILYVEILHQFGPDYIIEAGWLGVVSFGLSLFLSPFVIALCRRKSTRLTAVLGGLVMALACLFTSFAQQMHQVFLSYGIVMGVGVGLTRETSNLMIGQYFKRRREFIEIIVQSGSGIGIALFSVFLKEAISSIGWRLGLQAITGVLFLCFILGVFYRSASLYHPQRRAILHIKNQKRKVKDKTKVDDKPPYFDFSTLKTKTLQIIMLAAGISALGLYTPLFFMMFQGTHEGLESSSLILLQTFIGFAFAIGCVGFGLVVVRQSEQCMIARQYLCQASLFGLGISILALTAVQGYHGYVLFVWIYGIFLGGYQYSIKMFTLEKVRARFFSRAWGFVQWAQSLPVLFGVPISGYINSWQGSKSGYYFSCTFTLMGAGTLFILNLYKRSMRRRDPTVSFSSIESHVSNGTYTIHAPVEPDGDIFVCEDPDREKPPALARLGKSISFATSVDVIDDKRPEYLTCISEEGLAENFVFDDFYPGECITSCNKVENFLMFSEFENNLLSSDSAVMNDSDSNPTPPPPPPSSNTSETSEEGLGNLAKRTILQKPRRNITVIEEMTTSV